MEGKEDDGRGQGKERCLTDIDHVMAATSAVDDAAKVMEDAVGAITPTLKCVKFDVDAAEGLVQNHDYKGLEEYVLEFLTKVQGNTSFYEHPGILCSIYQAEITHLIKAEQFVEAEKVFNDKVKPLLNHNTDELFRPADLEDRVKMVQNCVNNRKPPAADQDENIFGVVCDYLLLYFPSCMSGDRDRKGSVSDFLVAFDDDEKRERRLRCLACQWVIPVSTTAGENTKYFRSSDKHVECCFRVTKWMIQHLDSLKREPEIQGDVVVKPQQKKRKASGPLFLFHYDLDGKPASFAVTPALIEKHKAISLINMLAAVAIANENSESGAVAEGKEILSQLQKLISELNDLFFSSVLENAPVNSSLAFIKISSLDHLSWDLFWLLKLNGLPSACRVVADLYGLIIDMKTSFVIDDVRPAAKAIRPTTPSSTSSTGSNTPFAGTVGTDVPGSF